MFGSRTGGHGVGPAIFARDLFDGIASSYDLWAQVLCLFQYLRWRRFLVSQMTPRPGALVLDASTGTAGIAIEITRRQGSQSQVVGLDVSSQMLKVGHQAIGLQQMTSRIQLVQGSAEELPFPEDTFDVVVFTYLLRYVQEPSATMRELARVLKPGGQLLSLEFGIPENRWIRALWLVYTRGVMPVVTIPISHGWRRVGNFLGPSISDFYRRHPLHEIAEMWRRVGVQDVRVKYLSLGGAVVMWGTKQG